MKYQIKYQVLPLPGGTASDHDVLLVLLLDEGGDGDERKLLLKFVGLLPSKIVRTGKTSQTLQTDKRLTEGAYQQFYNSSGQIMSTRARVGWSKISRVH